MMNQRIVEDGWKRYVESQAEDAVKPPPSPALLRLVRAALCLGILLLAACSLHVVVELQRWLTAPPDSDIPFLSASGWICFFLASAGFCLGTAEALAAIREKKGPAVYLIEQWRLDGEDLRRLYGSSKENAGSVGCAPPRKEGA